MNEHQVTKMHLVLSNILDNKFLSRRSWKGLIKISSNNEVQIIEMYLHEKLPSVTPLWYQSVPFPNSL